MSIWEAEGAGGCGILSLLLLQPRTAQQVARARCAGFYVHSLPRGKERTKKARQRLQCLRPCEARCSRLANKQTCTFGLPKEVFLVRSLSDDKE